VVRIDSVVQFLGRFCNCELDWTQEIVIEFIELCKRKEIIWHPKHPTHFNKIETQYVWKEMGNFDKVLQANVRITTCQET
jgi:hypothetical protein